MTKQTEPATNPAILPDTPRQHPALKLKTRLKAGFIGDVPRTG